MACEDRYDLRITDSAGESHGLLADWGRGGAGLRIDRATDALKSTAVSTKGDFGVRDVTDSFRICQTDWSQGSGQKTYDRDADSESAFDSSLGIDVSTVGEFKLGPELERSAELNLAPAIIYHENAVFAARSAAETEDRVRWSTDGATWYSMSMPTSPGPDSTPTGFASDGDNLYCVTTTGQVWRVGLMQATQFGSAADMTHLAFASGTLYGTQDVGVGGDAQLGTFTAAGAWSALSPEFTSAFNAIGSTFGLVASGNYVYWGLTSGVVTKVYKALYGGGTGADVLQAVATFPSGFVGASMYAYLGTIYVGGHFDGVATDTGIGSIYAIVGDSAARLTDVGEDATKDNRVLAISAYERSLYFVSDSQVWRWDLVHGGYSHYAGPLNATPVTPYANITWIGEWAMDAAPGTGAEPDATVTDEGTVSAIYSMGYMNLTFSNQEAGWRRYLSGAVAGMNDGTGTTLEVAVSNAFIDSSHNLTGLCAAIRGSAKQAAFYVYKVTGASTYTVLLLDGGSRSATTVATGYVNTYDAHTFRLTLKGSAMKLYVDGALFLTGTSTSASTDRKIYLELTRPTDGKANDDVTVGNVRWSVGGAYSTDLLTQTPVTGIGLACWRDKVIAACSGVGFAYSSPTSYPVSPDPEPYLLSSLSSGNMPTVEKWLSAIHVSHKEVAIDEDGDRMTDLTCAVIIDGKPVDLTLDADLSSATLSVFPIGMNCRTIAWRITPTTTTSTLTPRITDVAVLFTPTPKVPRLYTYFIRCWRDAEDNTGHDWDEDAPTVSDWLEEIAGTVVTVGRTGRASYNGRIEQLELLEAPPSGAANGREGLFQIQVKEV